MLVGQFVVSVALYCQRCGKIHIHDVPFFDRQRKRPLLCDACGHTKAILLRDAGREIEFIIPCVVCQREHKHIYTLRQLTRIAFDRIYCGHDRFELGYLGRRRRVEEFIRYNNLLSERQSVFSLENQQRFLEGLNQVHDLVEMGEVICSCGRREFIARMTGDSIVLNCTRCGGEAEISLNRPSALRGRKLGADITFARKAYPSQQT